MPNVKLGNTSAVVAKKIKDDSDEVEFVSVDDLGDTVTRVEIPGEYNLIESLRIVGDLWKYHSDKPPAWVESDNEALASLIAELYKTDDHTVDIGEPDGWGE